MLYDSQVCKVETATRGGDLSLWLGDMAMVGMCHDFCMTPSSSDINKDQLLFERALPSNTLRLRVLEI